MTPKKLIIVDQDGKKIDNHLKIVVVNDPGLISKISNTKVVSGTEELQYLIENGLGKLILN